MKLSVAMITYNHERFIRQAIESVLAQKVNFDFEIVIGEDCSTDSTRAIVAELQQQYPELIVALMRPHNLGAMRNLQETLAACKGQYIAFLEGDDYWTAQHKLQKQVDFLDARPDCAISCHRTQFTDEMNSGHSSVFPSLPAGTYSIDDLLRGNFIMTCSAVCRWRSMGRLPDWFLGLKLADWPMFALLARAGTIELMDDVMAAYRVHSGGVWSGRPDKDRLQEAIRMLRILERDLGPTHADAIRKTIAEYYLRLAEIAQTNGRRVETGICLINCLRSGGALPPDTRPVLRGLGWYTALGSLHPPLVRIKRAILG
ncbi:MAG TPA: glycosyltransferase [Candidatus Dormibacteraeota bacterium]|nr:glycosyltransferase [Candidatus Dormibacteraeota bacterium]